MTGKREELGVFTALGIEGMKSEYRTRHEVHDAGHSPSRGELGVAYPTPAAGRALEGAGKWPSALSSNTVA